MSGSILQIRNLDVRFQTPDGEVHAVKRANIDIAEGECLGVVGESGSGKSQLFLGALGLLSNNGRATGSVKFCGEELLGLPQSEINRVRGSRITMIFQDPLTSLTPHLTIGAQIIESLRVHQHLPYAEALRRSLEILDLVRIPEARERMQQFPHELSGGMRQRVMIAMATACGPDLLVADEPTTALDVTVQAQILELIRKEQRELGMAVIFVTHDLGIVAGLCDKVQVMYAGRIVETADAHTLYHSPLHPYTRALQRSIPGLQPKGGELFTIPGFPPDVSRPPAGCAFAPRCGFATDACGARPPELVQVQPGHWHACTRSQAGEIRV